MSGGEAVFGKGTFLRRAGLVVFAVLMALTGARCGSAAAPTTQIIGFPVPSSSTLPGTPGHFDNGEFSFDYPADWPVLADDVESGGVMYILAVMGQGTWREGCVRSGNSMTCGADTFDVAAGGILVKVYRWWGSPFVPCSGDVQANATFGGLAVRQRTSGSVTSWEIRVPGNEFGQGNNIFFEAHTSEPAQLAKAEAIVASFRWSASAGPGACASTSPGVS